MVIFFTKFSRAVVSKSSKSSATLSIVFSKLSAINGFEVSLPWAVCYGLANSSSLGIWWVYDHIVFGKLSTINGFVKSLPVAVCSGLVDSFVD